MSDSATSAQVRWAHGYDGYRRLASGPEALADVLGGARDAYLGQGRVPQWCGVDLLRGWAFYLAREDRHRGGDTLGDEWTAVLDRLRIHEDATGADRPPPDARALVDLPSVFSTEPKRHKDSAFLAAKQARLWESHVGPINQFVDQIRHEIAREWQEAHQSAAPPVFVPYVDPDSGGIQARVLFVLESPAGPAALGSGMLSADNNDETAKNVWRSYQASGMPRTYGLHWNAVPWYVGDGKKNKKVTASDVTRGRDYLCQLLDLAPSIRVVLALGKPAQASVAGAADVLASRRIRIINAPHPSPIPAAATKGASLEEFNAAVAQAYSVAVE
jgi:uracil-DNA glycosylase